MKRVPLEPAYVLSRRPYRETSALLEIFSAAHGRVGLVARGVRAARSRLRGQLEPFRPLLLSWVEGGELGTLTGAESGGRPPALPPAAIFPGWYLNELLLRLLPRRDPHPALFRDYEAALQALAGAGIPVALRIFEKRLLAELGYGLRLPPATRAGAWYTFDEDAGIRRAAGPDAAAFRGSSLLALWEERLDTPEALRDAQRLLRRALSRPLGGRPLETPRLLRALRATGQRAPGVRER